MPIPRDILEAMKKDLEEAKKHLEEIDDIITDMRYAGLDASEFEKRYDELTLQVRRLELFIARQEAKQTE